MFSGLALHAERALTSARSILNISITSSTCVVSKCSSNLNFHLNLVAHSVILKILETHGVPIRQTSMDGLQNAISQFVSLKAPSPKTSTTYFGSAAPGHLKNVRRRQLR